MSQFFTNLEDIVYSVVEYIPGVGTVYSFKRAFIALNHHDSKRFWQSAANSLESQVRDAVLYTGTTEIATVAIIHTSHTDKSIEIYLHEPDKPKPKLKITKNLDEQKQEHVLINEPPHGNFKNQVFRGKAKGVHYFHGAVFIGTFVNSNYAPNGENIRLDVPHGFYDGARVFAWKWTQDAGGVKNRPEITMGHIHLVAGTPTEFKLTNRKSAGGWEAYDFWGKILSKTQVKATFKISGRDHNVVFNRSPGT